MKSLLNNINIVTMGKYEFEILLSKKMSRGEVWFDNDGMVNKIVNIKELNDKR